MQGVLQRFWPGIGKVEMLAPGVWLDQVGNVHFVVSEMLQFLGSPDTPENRKTVADTLVGEAKRLCAGVQG